MSARKKAGRCSVTDTFENVIIANLRTEIESINKNSQSMFERMTAENEALKQKLAVRNSALMEIRDAAPWGSDTPDYDLQLWMREQADAALKGQEVCPIIKRLREENAVLKTELAKAKQPTCLLCNMLEREVCIDRYVKLEEENAALKQQVTDAEMANVEAVKLIATRNKELQTIERKTLERAAEIAHRKTWGNDAAEAIRKEITA
jgi:hypothetical protein